MSENEQAGKLKSTQAMKKYLLMGDILVGNKDSWKITSSINYLNENSPIH